MEQESSRFDAEPFEPTSQSLNSRDLLGIVWRRKALVLLGIVVGVVLGSFYYVVRQAVHESAAEVLVIKKRPDVVAGNEMKMSHFEDYVTTHQELIKSPLIINRAIEARNLRSLNALQGEEDSTEAIVRALSISRKTAGSAGRSSENILKLSFRATVKEDCGVVLNAIIDSYKAFLDETYQNISDDTEKLIKQARTELLRDLEKKDKDYAEFRRQMPVLLAKGKEGSNLRQERLTSIEAKRSALLVHRAELQGHLAAVESALQEDGQNRDALIALVTDSRLKLESDTDAGRGGHLMTLKDQLFPLLLEEQRLLQTYGERYPEVQSIRQRITRTRDFFSRPSASSIAVPEIPGAAKAPVPTDPVELHIQYLKQQINHSRISEKMFTDLLENEQAEARKLTQYELQDEAFRNDIMRTQQLYTGVVKRLQDTDLVKGYGGFVAQTISPAGSTKKVSPSAILVFPMALFLGLCGGVGLAWLAEISDKSFRSPEEIRRRLGLSVLAQIPLVEASKEGLQQVAAGESTLDPMLCTYYRPKSAHAEAFRGLRTALYFSTRGEQHQVIQVTSADVGDGKSTLIANLAVSMAQSGKRILLIDADCRRPRMHKIFGLSDTLGLSTILSGETEEVADAIQTSAVGGLSIITAGPIPPNPSELLTLSLFKELLDKLREQYDFVLVDTPPLLAVTDPGVVAPRVDGVILTLRMSHHGRPHAERAKEILNSLGATVLGVVLNGIDPRDNRGAYANDYTSGNGAYYVDDSADNHKKLESTNGTNGAGEQRTSQNLH